MAPDGVRCVFVRWANAADMIGRIARVHKGRAVYPVVPGNKPRSFQGCEVVHPSIGVQLLRGRGSLATDLPAKSLRLQQMWQTAQSGGLPSSCSECALCKDGTGDVLACALCLMSWHPSCANKFATHVQTRKRIILDLPTQVDLPPLFKFDTCTDQASPYTSPPARSVLCSVCSYWVREATVGCLVCVYFGKAPTCFLT